MFAKIAVSAATFAIDKPYSYSCSENQALRPGMRVKVPFGISNRKVDGIVLSVEQGEEPGLKAVDRVLDEEPLISETMLRLAGFMRERYFCTFYEAARVMLPAGLWFKVDEVFTLTDDRSWKDTPPKNTDAVRILTHMESLGGTVKGEGLRALGLGEENCSRAVQYLLRKKWISADRNYSRRTADKTEKIATLASSFEEAMEYARRRGQEGLPLAQLVELLAAMGSVSVKELCYFTGVSQSTIRTMVKRGYLTLGERPVSRCRMVEPVKDAKPIVLKDAQAEVFAGLKAQMARKAPGSALLYGVTGSGKTAVYIKLIEHCIAMGKQAMLLVPEIALTPQLLGLMAAYFGETVAVLHSSLPSTERYDQWKRVRAGEAKLVVGTRSAVFAPCADPGLIILDEEQEHSYKSENSPRYNAKEVALWRGIKEGALVLYGSATPSIETMYRAKQGVHRLYTLTQRYNGRPLPKVEIVDMQQELRVGNDLSFSLYLQEAIRETADRGKQSILFLNRRGNSRALVCINCGEAPQCPRCATRLNYHSANNRLMCHLCGFSRPVTERCEACGGPVKQVGTGTQKVQQELESVFSDMEIARMDADTVSATNTHEKILAHFKEDNVPVLVGTQMVAKGLDLPNVTLVGVVDADLGLYTESFRAAETTFNMLTQVVGRAGRGDASGRAILQTLSPNNRIINLAARQDYDAFFAQELALRQGLRLPPFYDLAVITLVGIDEGKLLRGGQKLRESLEAALAEDAYAAADCTVLGPAPCAVPRINYNFRYRLTLRCKLNNDLRRLIAHMVSAFMKDGINRGVGIFVDVNPMDG